MNALRTKKRSCYAALLFLAPSLIGFLTFYIIPFFAGLYYSFITSPVNGRFIGFSNYVSLLKNPIFQRATSNTFIFTGFSVPLLIMLSLCLAMLLNRKIPANKTLRTLFITPLVIPVASVILVWQVLFDRAGSVNFLLAAMGFQPVDWMRSSWARVVVILLYVWKNIGYNMVLFLAGLQSVPAEYYESADIDGAGPFSKFTKITLVYLTPVSFFVLIMTIINSFKVFRETYSLAGAYPHDSIYMLQHYMNNMFASLDYQKLTSAAFLMAVLMIFLVSFMFFFERKIRELLS